jgi:hypothetical protein
VPIVTNINTDVLAVVHWRARLGAFCPRSGFLGTGVLGYGLGGGVVAVPRVREAVPAPQSGAPAAKLGQTNNYIQMTSVLAVGEGASGPPPEREPA